MDEWCEYGWMYKRSREVVESSMAFGAIKDKDEAQHNTERSPNTHDLGLSPWSFLELLTSPPPCHSPLWHSLPSGVFSNLDSLPIHTCTHWVRGTGHLFPPLGSWVPYFCYFVIQMGKIIISKSGLMFSVFYFYSVLFNFLHQLSCNFRLSQMCSRQGLKVGRIKKSYFFVICARFYCKFWVVGY